VQVIEPVPAPKYDYTQGLEEMPVKATNTPISWAQIYTFWSGDVNVHHMGSSAARMILKDGVLVNQKLNSITKKANMPPSSSSACTLARNWRTPSSRSLESWTISRTSSGKYTIPTVQNSSVGTVAGRDDDDEEEVSSGGVQLTKSTSGTKVRARDNRSALKEVTS